MKTKIILIASLLALVLFFGITNIAAFDGNSPRRNCTKEMQAGTIWLTFDNESRMDAVVEWEPFCNLGTSDHNLAVLVVSTSNWEFFRQYAFGWPQSPTGGTVSLEFDRPISGVYPIFYIVYPNTSIPDFP